MFCEDFVFMIMYILFVLFYFTWFLRWGVVSHCTVVLVGLELKTVFSLPPFDRLTSMNHCTWPPCLLKW